jgi:hypothetical protein
MGHPTTTQKVTQNPPHLSQTKKNCLLLRRAREKKKIKTQNRRRKKDTDRKFLFLKFQTQSSTFVLQTEPQAITAPSTPP